MILLGGIGILLVLSILILIRVDKKNNNTTLKSKDYPISICTGLGVDDGQYPCGQWYQQSKTSNNCRSIDDGGNITIIDCDQALQCCDNLQNCKLDDGSYNDTCSDN
jgi:hypothetical protein